MWKFFPFFPQTRMIEAKSSATCNSSRLTVEEKASERDREEKDYRDWNVCWMPLGLIMTGSLEL
jgi:hypothetical protein